MNISHMQTHPSACGTLVGGEVVHINQQETNFAGSVQNQYFTATNNAGSSSTQTMQPAIQMCHSLDKFMGMPNRRCLRTIHRFGGQHCLH